MSYNEDIKKMPEEEEDHDWESASDISADEVHSSCAIVVDRKNLLQRI